MRLLIISVVALVLLGGTKVFAQTKLTVGGGADFVSSYVWRGNYNAGASVQPSLSAAVGSFSLGAWGSTDITGNEYKELDFSAHYTIAGFKAGVTNYWWPGERVFHYLHYSDSESAHLFEGNLTYTLPCKRFPLSASWNTMFYGHDYDADGHRAYSTYIELGYSFQAADLNMLATVGIVPWYSPIFIPVEHSGFNVSNIGLKVGKAIPISERFSLPIFTQLIINPTTEDAYFIFGVSLSF